MAEATAETPKQAHAREMARLAREFDAAEHAKERLHEAAPAMRDALRAFVATADEYNGLPFDTDAIRAIKRHAIAARAALAAADATPVPTSGGEG